MTWFVFVYHVLFLLYFISYESEGKITSPPDGTNQTIVPGGNDSIIWSFDDDINTVTSRSWNFKSGDGLRSESLGVIPLNLAPALQSGILPGISITKPATLVLNNVNQSYDGTYTFSISSSAGNDESIVRVFIAKKPNVTLSCLSLNPVNKGDDFTCVCRDEDGNPPSNVTWYKDGNKFGDTKTQINTLTLSNVNGTHARNYTCEARSYTGDEFMDNKTIAVQVFSKPNVSLGCPSYNQVNENDSFTCVGRDLDGDPPSNVTWYKDDKQIGETKMQSNTLTLTNVTKADNGSYTCEARNYPGDKFVDAESIVVQVRFKPNTMTRFGTDCHRLGGLCIVTCNSTGFPAPNHTISHNGKEVSPTKTYTIDVVTYSDAGIYKCVATNPLGNDSDCKILNVTAPPTTTPFITSNSSTPQSTPNTTTTTTVKPPDPIRPLPPWVIVIIIIAVLLVLLIIGYVIYRIKKKEKEGYSGNADVSPGEDGEFGINHYELDEPPASADNEYASVSNETQKKPPPPENTEPAVYASVNKEKREGKPLYATLDSLALEQGDKSKKKPKDERPPQTEYASIDFAKIGKNDEN